MAEYIPREAAVEMVKRICNCALDARRTHLDVVDDGIEMMRGIASMPAADVAPVVHARWAHLGGDEWCCSVCGFVITTEGSWDKPTKKYCEDCGAKMDGGADHEAD